MRKSNHICANLALAGIVVASFASAASAQSWQRGQFKYERGPHSFGARCEYRIVAHGAAPLKFFGGNKNAQKAERRAIQDWEDDAGRLFGARYASWDRAAGKSVQCRIDGLRFNCQASAHPCRDGGGPERRGRDGREGHRR